MEVVQLGFQIQDEQVFLFHSRLIVDGAQDARFEQKANNGCELIEHFELIPAALSTSGISRTGAVPRTATFC